MTTFQQNGTFYNLAAMPVDIEDTSFRSDNYFVISDLPTTFTAGKNYFTINGTGNLKKNSLILIEILDSKGNPLYYEIGKRNDLIYTSADATIVSPRVYKSTTEWGTGKIYIVGTTIDNQKVRWSTSIKIDPNAENSSNVIFYNSPKLELSEELSLLVKQGILVDQKSVTLTGSFVSYGVYPKLYSLYTNVDINDLSNYDYRFKYPTTSSLPQSNLFSSKNIGTEFILNIGKIGYLSPEQVLKTQSVSLTQSFFINDVINSYEVSTQSPFIYKIGGYSQICSILESTFKTTYTDIPYVTRPIFSGSSIDVNGDYNTDLFQNIPSGSNNTPIFYKRGYLNVTLTNLRTISGKPHRYKIYKKSFNESSDFSLAGDGKLESIELLKDDFALNNFYGNVGKFYNQFHIDKYYYKFYDTGSFYLTQSSEQILNSMIFSASNDVGENSYVIIKKNTAIQTSQSLRSNYVAYDAAEYAAKRGPSYDSNFIEIYPNVNYVFDCDLDMIKSIDSSKDAKLTFYLTGSFNTSNNIGDTNYIRNKGLKIAEYILPKGRSNLFFEKQNSEQLFSVVNKYIGTIVIIPSNLQKFRISDISLRSYTEFGFSPDLFFAKIPYQINAPNEAQSYNVELLDVNSNASMDTINAVVRLDETGESIYGTSLLTYEEQDPKFLNSPAYLTTYDHINYLTDYVIDNKTASLSLSSSYARSSSYAVSSSYIVSSSYSVSSSYAVSSSYLKNTIGTSLMIYGPTVQYVVTGSSNTGLAGSSVSFPVTFASTPLVFTNITNGDTTTTMSQIIVSNITTTGFSHRGLIITSGSSDMIQSNVLFNWMAIGTL